MQKVMQYKDILLDEFHLDSKGKVIRNKDGYGNSYLAGDIAKFYIVGNYYTIQIPNYKVSIRKNHLVMLLSGFTIEDDQEVDHIDGNSLNDHPSNLRLITRRVNACNRKKMSNNSSGITGISWDKVKQRYVIRRTVNGKRITKFSKDLEEAKLILASITAMDSNYTERHGK